MKVLSKNKIYMYVCVNFKRRIHTELEIPRRMTHRPKSYSNGHFHFQKKGGPPNLHIKAF